MRRVLAITAFMLLSAAPRATVLVPADFREIVTGSQVIVHGRVIAVEAAWSDDRRRISTLVTIEAGTYLKGGPGATATFRVPGGTIGRYRNVMVGAPEFKEGDEAVFFLRGDGPQVATIFGLTQGLFRVRTDAATGRRVVLPAAVAQGDAPQRIVRGAVERRLVPLEDFAREVRGMLAQGGDR